MPYFYYFVGWCIVMFFHIVGIPRLTFSGVFPDIVLGVVTLIGLKRGRTLGLWFGFVFGFSLDLLQPVSFGWSTLLVSLSGFLSGMVREKIYVESGYYQTGIIVIVAFVYQLTVRVIHSPGYLYNNVGASLMTSLLVGAYTGLLAGVALILLKQRYRLREFL
jgi:rod shape-determining protein MreD